MASRTDTGTGKRLPAVQGTEKTIEILELLATCNRKLPLTEIASRLGVSRRDSLLLLVTLENLGFLFWNADERVYCAAARCEELCRGLADRSRSGCRKGARPHKVRSA